MLFELGVTIYRDSTIDRQTERGKILLVEGYQTTNQRDNMHLISVLSFVQYIDHVQVVFLF